MDIDCGPYMEFSAVIGQSGIWNSWKNPVVDRSRASGSACPVRRTLRSRLGG